MAELKLLTLPTIQDSFNRWFLNKDKKHRSVSVMLFGKGKTVTLDEAVVNGESEEGCGVRALDTMQSIFPSLHSDMIARDGGGSDDGTTITTTTTTTTSSSSSISDTGVSVGLLVESLDALKDVRETLDVFDPPADDGEEEEDGCDDDEGCELVYD